MMTSAHSIVFVGLLPLATAVFGVLRGGERPWPVFWVFSVHWAACWSSVSPRPRDRTAAPQGDLLMLLAILACGLGHAEAREAVQDARWLAGDLLGAGVGTADHGRRTWWRVPVTLANISAPAWLSLGYVSLFSMLIGFVFWYRGLAQGGIAAVGQLQLLQPFFGLALAATLLHEQVSLGCLE